MPRLLPLMLGAFVAQTTEYLPIGLLPQIAASLDVSPARAGFLVTGYAWVAALTAVPFTLATRRLPRRTLFLGLLVVITLANALATFADSYTLLIALRVLTALTHGVFWSMIAPYAVRLAPAMPASRATAWALGGISVALVAGVPMATALGHWLGWRSAFAAYAVLGAVTVALSFKPLASSGEAPPAALPLGLPRRSAALSAVALATLLIVAAHFTGYTYVVPILAGVVHAPETRHALFLTGFGIAGVIGTWLAGGMVVSPAALTLLAALGVVASQVALLWTGTFEPAAWLEVTGWGASAAMLIVGLQSWVMAIAPEQAEAASSLYVAAFNLGIGGGALAGGLALARSGVDAVLRTSSTLGVLALLSLVIAWQWRTARTSASRA